MEDLSLLIKPDRRDIVKIHTAPNNEPMYTISVKGKTAFPFPIIEYGAKATIENLNKIPLSVLVLIDHNKLKLRLFNELPEMPL